MYQTDEVHTSLHEAIASPLRSNFEFRKSSRDMDFNLDTLTIPISKTFKQEVR